MEDKIISLLEEKGIYECPDFGVQMNKVCEYFAIHFTDTCLPRDLDFFVYEETTADGFIVYVCTYDMQRLCIGEDVYQYPRDLAEEIVNFVISERNQTDTSVYISDIDSHWFKEAIEELYGKLYQEEYEKIENKLEENEE